MKNAKCAIISSKCWYTCAAGILVIWIAAALMGGEREGTVREALREFLADKRIATRFFDREDVNPAPSVVLEVESAPWCLPCQRLKPVLRKLEKEGYEIKITETNHPSKPVPNLDFVAHGKVERNFTGIPAGHDPYTFLKATFAEVEGAVFKGVGVQESP